jgi:hypothetical protein
MVRTIKKVGKIQLIAIIALATSILTFSHQTSPARCLPANSMWIEPTTIELNATTPVGYRFNVTIYANLSVASYAWQFFLTYNKEHLNATGCWYSAGEKSQWAGTRPTSPQTPRNGSHNATHNYVLFGESLSGVVETPPGSYSLAIVEFEVISVEQVSQIRLDVKGVFDSYILDPDLNEIQPLNFGGTTVIDEFSTLMFLMSMLFASFCAVLLRKKWSKIDTAYYSQR